MRTTRRATLAAAIGIPALAGPALAQTLAPDERPITLAVGFAPAAPPTSPLG